MLSNDGEHFVAFYLWFVTFSFFGFWMLTVLCIKGLKEYFYYTETSYRTVPPSAMVKVHFRRSTPLPGPGGSHRAPPSWSWAPIEHLPTRCLYAGSGSPCDAEDTWQSTAKWDRIFLLCGLHSVENIIKHGCFTMFRQIEDRAFK